MSNKYYSSIPQPAPDLQALYESVTALKQIVEVLTGQRGAEEAKPLVASEVGALLEQARFWRARPSTKAGLPINAVSGQLAFVTDEAGGAVLAFYDGTNWRRATDRAVVS